MSPDNALSAITYTSISSDSEGQSWGIPLINVDELLEMVPYEEVSQQGHAPPLSPAYVPNPIELDEHVPVYVPEPEHPKHISNSESMEEVSIDYPDEPEDDDEDSKEDPKEDHTDYPADGGDGDDEPFNDDEDDDTDDEDEEPIEDEDDEEEEDEHLALADSSVTVILEPPMSASIEACIAEHAAALIPPTSPTYDHAPLGYREAMIHMRVNITEEDMPPQRRFVLTAPLPGCDVAESSAAAAKPPRADRAEEVGYVKALQVFEHRMMTSIEEVNLRISYQAQVHRKESEDFYTQLHDARTDHRDIRLEIDIVRGQRTAYETKLHERESVEDLAVRQMMRIHVLEARAQIATVEDTCSSY
uniref:Reverse transcriptase domain-containing protein n=1 Tax=Tanacetum cinerariifolium TaxID=118510 RepID=A0A6L2KP28_TANCI|nr:hypothetical protein [Tanacetum cinerariifolium]